MKKISSKNHLSYGIDFWPGATHTPLLKEPTNKYWWNPETPCFTLLNVLILTNLGSSLHLINNITRSKKLLRTTGICWFLDPSIGHFVPDKPLFTFRRASSIGDRVVSNKFKSDSNRSHCKFKGTFMCGTCHYCKYMLTQRNPTLPNGRVFYPKHYANCRTPGVVYML